MGVEKFDRLRFGPLVNALSQLESWRDGLVMLYADHGEAQRPFSNWSIDHGSTIEENLVRVPLLVRGPRVAPREIHELVGLVDLFPTVVDLTDVPGLDAGTQQTLDGRSLVDALDGRPHGVHCYWLEGWHFAETDREATTCVKSRGLRYADGRKYSLHGDLVSEDDYAGLSDDEFISYAGRHTYGTNPTPWFQNRLRTALASTSRPQILQMLFSEVRQFRYCANVDQDLLEESVEVLNARHPRWAEYQPQLERMLAQTGEPCLRDGDADVDQAHERLAALGYV